MDAVPIRMTSRASQKTSKNKPEERRPESGKVDERNGDVSTIAARIAVIANANEARKMQVVQCVKFRKRWLGSHITDL